MKIVKSLLIATGALSIIALCFFMPNILLVTQGNKLGGSFKLSETNLTEISKKNFYEIYEIMSSDYSSLLSEATPNLSKEAALGIATNFFNNISDITLFNLPDSANMHAQPFILTSNLGKGSAAFWAFYYDISDYNSFNVQAIVSDDLSKVVSFNLSQNPPQAQYEQNINSDNDIIQKEFYEFLSNYYDLTFIISDTNDGKSIPPGFSSRSNLLSENDNGENISLFLTIYSKYEISLDFQ